MGVAKRDMRGFIPADRKTSVMRVTLEEINSACTTPRGARNYPAVWKILKILNPLYNSGEQPLMPVGVGQIFRVDKNK